MARDPQEEQLFRAAKVLMGQIAVGYVRPLIPSQTLQDELDYAIVDGKQEGVRLVLRSFWAIYLHDGRGPVLPKEAQFVVFWRDPREDPRLSQGRYPERRSELRRLSKAEFQFGLKQNTAARKAGLPPPMIVMRTKDFQPVPVSATEGTYFFDVPEVLDIILDKLSGLFEGHIVREVLRAGVRRRRTREKIEFKIRI